MAGVFFRKQYYFLKPYIPWRLRVALRRRMARRAQTVGADSWPISVAAGQAPDGWPGWPDGRQFAFVLTHDVEGIKGLERVPHLMELEKRLGFRSSFNFIPEGPYSVSQALRHQLVAEGFEVGVHGLHHDGKLYNSRSLFRKRAIRINRYLKDWGAVGFRSPFMHHNLDWIHDLAVQYDASTFDTDPFEPQPDGAGTIFPFWVPSPSPHWGAGRGEVPPLAHPTGEGVRRTGEGVPSESPPSDFGFRDWDFPARRAGYVELPYTLVQDFNLFVVLQAKTIDIWKQKLDWLAERGGMALLDTHPDYMHFAGTGPGAAEYDVGRYQEFLEYVSTRYAGQYWHALPRDVAARYRPFRPRQTGSRSKRICMVTYSYYESDTRVMQYAGALASRGDQVDVLALSDGKDRPNRERIGGVTVYRLQQRLPDEQTQWDFAWRLAGFCCASSWRLARLHGRHRYDLVHVHNVPDFLVFAALYPRLTGAKVILDIHDLMPELYASKFDGTESSLGPKVLRLLERVSARVAHHVIVANHLWLSRVTSRAVPEDRCTAFINYLDPNLFRRHPRTRPEGKVVVIYPGSLQWHQGLDVAIRAFAIFLREVTGAEFHIYGEGQAKGELVRLIDKLGLGRSVSIRGWVETSEVPELLANADLGVVPKRADSFGNEAYSTKILEFMSQGLPVVASRTKIDRFYFNDGVVCFFESGNAEDMARQMVEVVRNHELRNRLVQNALEYAVANSWDAKKGDYLHLVDTLIAGDRAFQHLSTANAVGTA